jgi:HlyD family secretion protein
MIRSNNSMDRPVESAKRGFPLGLAIGGLTLLLALFFLGPAVSRWARSDRSVDTATLRFARVERGDLVRDTAVEGRIVAAQSPALFAPERGVVQFHVQEGDQLEKGALIATVASPELQSRLDQERSSLASLESESGRQQLAERQQNLENLQQVDLRKVRAEAAKRALSRAKRNFDEGVIGAVELEKAQDDLAIAELELAHSAKTAELERERLAFESSSFRTRAEGQRLVVGELQRQVAELQLRSPVAGQLARFAVRDRDAVQQGQEIATVVDLSVFEVEIDVPESYAPQAEIGMPVELRLGAGTWPGKLRTLAPQVVGSVVTGRVAFEGGTPPGIKQSQRLTARLIFESKKDVLLVERGPFVESGGGRVAWVVQDRIARPRKIEIGAVGVSHVEIKMGLEVGEEIVISDSARFQGAEAVLLR